MYEYKIEKNLPILGMAMCKKWACSWSWALPSSAWSPSRSFPRISWGTLHPHPLRSANLVRRKVTSRSCAMGSNGLRKARAFGLLPSSSWATDRASWLTGTPCSSAILFHLPARSNPVSEKQSKPISTEPILRSNFQPRNNARRFVASLFYLKENDCFRWTTTWDNVLEDWGSPIADLLTFLLGLLAWRSHPNGQPLSMTLMAVLQHWKTKKFARLQMALKGVLKLDLP